MPMTTISWFNASRVFDYDTVTRRYEAPRSWEAGSHKSIMYWQQIAAQLHVIRGVETQKLLGILPTDDNYGKPWHGYYTGKPAADSQVAPGLCVKMKYMVYEPSSLDAYNFTTPGLTIHVPS